MIYLGYRLPSVKGLTFREKIDLAVKLNLKAVELGPEDVAGTTDDLKEMKDMVNAAGLMMKSLGIGGAPMCKPAPRDEAVKNLKGVLEKARFLGLDMIFSRTMNPEPGVRQEDAWNYCADSFRLFAALCEDSGIKFALEVDHGCFVQNYERTEYLFEKVNHKNLYLNYDPANFYIGGSDPVKVIDKMKRYIVSGHIKDGVYRTDKIGEAKIGEGEVNYEAIFQKLEEENISIAMHLEHCKCAEDVIDGAAYIHGVLSAMKRTA